MIDKAPFHPLPTARQPLAAQADQWAAQITAAQRRAGLLALPAWVLLGLGAVVLCLTMNVLRPWARIALPLTAAAVAGALLLAVLAERSRRRTATRLAVEIRDACRRAGLAAGDAVRLLTGRGNGRLYEEVLAGLDRDAAGLADIHRQGEQAFRLLELRPVPRLQFQVVRGGWSVSAVILQGEHRIDEFAGLAGDCLARRLDVEAIAALAMVDMIYHEIAPAGPDRPPLPGPGDASYAATAEAALTLFSGFSLLPEMEALSGARRLAVRDEGLVGACIDYIGRRTGELYKRDRAWELLARIPDARTLPHLLDAFEHHAFFPQGLAGLSLLGEVSHARLVEAVHSGRGRLRFHAALALGRLPTDTARPALEALLPSVRSPVERAGLLAALVRLGADEHLAELQGLRHDRDAEARQAAEIALAQMEGAPARLPPGGEGSAAMREAAIEGIDFAPGSRVKVLALQALRGDAQATARLAGMLRPRTDFVTLLELLEAAPLLGEPAFAAPLRKLLTYRNPAHFPGDRSISYLALKALVHSELARP